MIQIIIIMQYFFRKNTIFLLHINNHLYQLIFSSHSIWKKSRRISIKSIFFKKIKDLILFQMRSMYYQIYPLYLFFNKQSSYKYNLNIIIQSIHNNRIVYHPDDILHPSLIPVTGTDCKYCCCCFCIQVESFLGTDCKC